MHIDTKLNRTGNRGVLHNESPSTSRKRCFTTTFFVARAVMEHKGTVRPLFYSIIPCARPPNITVAKLHNPGNRHFHNWWSTKKKQKNNSNFLGSWLESASVKIHAINWPFASLSHTRTSVHPQPVASLSRARTNIHARPVAAWVLAARQLFE